MSSSLPSLLLLSTGSARISTPGPTRLDSPRWDGKIYAIELALDPLQTCPNHPGSTPTPTSIPSPLQFSPSQTYSRDREKARYMCTYLRPTPPQPIRRLIRHQLPKAQHQPIHKRQQQIDRGAAHEAPQRGRLVENQGRRGRRGR